MKINDILLKFLPFLAIFIFNSCTGKQLQMENFKAEESQLCWQLIQVHHTDKKALEKQLNSQIYDFQEEVEETLVSREKSLTLINDVISNSKAGKPVSPAKIDALNLSIDADIKSNQPIVRHMVQNGCWQQADAEKMKALSLPALSNDIRIKGSMLELAASLVLYDTYLSIVTIVNEHDRLRRFSNQSDSGYGISQDKISEVTNTFLNMANLNKIQSNVKVYKKYKAKISRLARHDNNIAYLHLLIRTSHAYAVFDKIGFGDIVDTRSTQRRKNIRDNLNALNRSAVNGLSKMLGNAAGSYEERKGKLYATPEVETFVASQLKAGDILLEKTPFRLTDKMIPGHWGHAAIWIGTEEEIRELGIWDHKIVRKYHDAIREKRLVVESLRSGTTLNSLADFLNIDDLAVLREKALLSKEARAKIIILALRQMGKAYDFNYDVETTDKIVCSQLVYLAYADISWPTDNVVGRHTISPDNIAIKALHNGPLEMVLFYHDGKIVKHNQEKIMQGYMSN